VQKPGIDEKKVRDQLKQERNLLIETYSKNPMQTHLAIEIKLIDDRIAELTEHLVRQKKSRDG
jgi:predicted  nucleic acid-binding Zn-ribbon protein